MNELHEFFDGLQRAIGAEDVTISGAWTSQVHRRYASKAQAGSGEGPFVDSTDWRWEGRFEAAAPLVSVALLVQGGRFRWVKSQPASDRLDVAFATWGWAGQPESIMVSGSTHGAWLPAVPLHLTVEPPKTWDIGIAGARTGEPYEVAGLGDFLFAVLLLPARAVQVGRNRLWHLREAFASQLRAAPGLLLSRGRSGEVDLTARGLR